MVFIGVLLLFMGIIIVYCQIRNLSVLCILQNAVNGGKSGSCAQS
jgi:hypothetical protein